MTPFTFILKDNTRKAFNNFFWFLFFVHIITASYIIINSGSEAKRTYAISVFIIWLLLSVGFYLLRHSIKLFSYQLVVLITMVFFWPLQMAWLPGLVVLFVSIFSLWLLQKKSSVTFSNKEVWLVKTVLTKKYQWEELDNVVLKDGLLSIDTKTNHLLQLEIIQDIPSETIEAFNDFCKERLQQSSAARVL